MAIYIQINKIEESPSEVTYEFGPSEEIIGRVLWSKQTGKMTLLEIKPQRRADYFLPRIERVLARNHAAGVYPDRTCYAA